MSHNKYELYRIYSQLWYDASDSRDETCQIKQVNTFTNKRVHQT